ncbi:hypothetical protein [Pontibacter indicus]|uniref:Uncharacterized protein n=1 Tax=Pontibacter indicus TaxID=1317125 RepID=A0A1R3XBA0_9BACT|nr:hypothetical protein [Pontibacter indicus]SIT88398.1 hypothetical protein SAMN05444128_1833 [Pontibacter indicus]
MTHLTKWKQAVLSVCFVLIATLGYSQDLIVKKSGEELIGKIVKVGEDTIHYRMLSEEKGPLRFVLRGDVASMQFATQPSSQQRQLSQLPQTTDEYASNTTAVPATAGTPRTYTQEELMYQGRHDALLYYKGQGPLWGTAGATFLFPPVGLVTGIVTAAVPPSVDNMFHPNYQLMKEPVYRDAFKKQAHKRKVGKAAAGFGIGFGSLIALALMLGAS